MKRLITFICLIVIIVAGYVFISKGVENDNFSIASYDTIESKSEALTKKLASYNKKNQEEYEDTVSTLNSSIKTYKNSKAKYEAIVEELAEVLNKDDEDESAQEILEEVIYSDKEKYKVDFLLVTMGDYSEREGVDVLYQLTTSSTVDPNSTALNYFLSDLKFTVTGQYMNVTNFISDLENDDKLNWEIREFTMENGTANGYTGVSARFTVKDVPIDSISYIESNTMSTDMTSDINEMNTGSGTVINQNTNMTTNTSTTNNTNNSNNNNNSNTVSNITIN